MTKPLENIRVAVTEHRYANEFAKLFERLGGCVRVCSLIEEVPVQNRGEIQSFVRSVTSGELDMLIFLTGVGARFLISEAEEMGMKNEFLASLSKLKVVVRGPKPLAALNRAGVRVDIAAATPTSEGLVETLGSQELQGKRVGVQLYGVANPYLCTALESMGAKVRAISIYTYGSPSDAAPIAALIRDIIDKQIDVITFTSAPQVRSLFETSESLGLSSRLVSSLKSGTIVASIGEVTNRALQTHGVTAAITSPEPKMGPMANAVAEFFKQRV
jgi:uroporphyrinogen-III synthase